MGGAIGALIYIGIEVIPDAGLVHGAWQAFPRRRRINELKGLILDNPSIGNYKELGGLYLDDRQFALARECFDRVLSKTDEVDPLYRRALCALALGDLPAAAADLERVVARDPKYDYQRAAGLLAQALAQTGNREKAAALFAEEARGWAERILLKKATMPDYIRRRERPWFRKAAPLLRSVK
jgi:tetratricopeptide (TPR) repeat protein